MNCGTTINDLIELVDSHYVRVRCFCGETHPCEHGYCRECLFTDCPVCDKKESE